MAYRIERDSLGEVKVEENKLWGAQTQRSFENFKIGTEKMPMEIIRAITVIKSAAARTNVELGRLDSKKGTAITEACDRILAGEFDDQFPLAVWQTGSGTQTNMNVNEVVANLAKAKLGSKVHPNDDVNMGQSSNDVFPSAMQMATVLEIERCLFPAIDLLRGTFTQLSEKYADLVKIGRTHLQDAVPLTLGQEIGGWAAMLEKTKGMIADSLKEPRNLALGGTAVGTGLNTHPKFGEMAAEKISQLTGSQFYSSSNKFYSLSSKSSLVFTHGALKALASDLLKIANDVRWLASGPRCGIGELKLPANEPGSSIMPGKVNPTQCEAMTMVCCQVISNDVAIGFAASQGNFQLNVYMPVIILNMLQSIRLLSDAIRSFHDKCVVGIEPNREKIDQNVKNSLMLVTALSPKIGYAKAAEVAQMASRENITLREAASKLKYLTEEEYDKTVIPYQMAWPHKS